jgi:protocatechuate 3,4-dioxygenase beta subunit
MPVMQRRLLLAAAAAAPAALALPALARSRRALPSVTEGPFYPSRDWRARQGTDWDADLTQVRREGRTMVARGEHFGLDAQVADASGRLIDGAEVEIWQCDALAAYRHPRVRAEPGTFDEGFQGFGAARSGRDGVLALRTIRPVPYPGRTPHIHVKLRHASFGEWTSQLFVAGDPGNARDFLWRAIPEADRPAAEMLLAPAPAGSGLAWIARHVLVVPV